MDLTFTEKVISSLGVPQIIDVSAQLPVNKNYSWPDLTGWRKLEDITTPALHHDAYPKANCLKYSPMQQMINIAKDHIKLTRNEPKGDPGFPYHIYIMRGQVYITNSIAAYTYGVAGNNPYTVHVCVHGDYKNYDQLTDDDLNCLIAVCLMLKRELPSFKEILGHGEINPTACPGYDMNRVRDAIMTTENRLTTEDSWKIKLEKVRELANEYQFLFDFLEKGESSGEAQWAMYNLLDVRQIMIERKLL